ncbi:hypothetical protein [Dyadobacter sandarakinus]|uniref:Uncharacterized protein n=1 Tax=Dyadobacter sandarakinus TaxID=2747268 RepID=A0ABX7I3G7_9BACT|nr:hypothetical protein [Dyadobacter sandarakinus]QRR00283.1 hypothetical protein HWI92_04875 [Dyadobacter sandarakinus]
MAKVTDFETWLTATGIQSEEDAYDLYSSIGNFEGSGRFYTNKEVTNDGYQYTVRAEGNEDTLFLESDEAKFAFFDHLANNYTESEEGDVDRWYKLRTKLGRID